MPLAGDWDGDGDGVATIGLYDPASSFFYLRNENSSGSAELSFMYGAAGIHYVPLAGDWDGHGATTHRPQRVYPGHPAA